MTELNLNLLPLYRLNNKELPALPGLLATTPPRKAARGREGDRLIVDGSVGLTPMTEQIVG